MTFATNSRLTKNEWITDPEIPEPENFPKPCGWLIAVRPYPVDERTQGGIILTADSSDFMNYLTNVGRVIAVGDCAYSRSEHMNVKGEQKPWVKPGDFISYPRHVGAKRKFKGVSYLLLVDDEVNEVLRDPLVYAKDDGVNIKIPESDLVKYNTVYNPHFSE